MELTPEDIDEILRYLEHSAFDELRLETPQFKLLVRRGQRAGVSGEPSAGSTLVVGGEPKEAEAPLTSEEPAEVASGEAQPAESSPPQNGAEIDGLVPIPAPLRGIFYRAPRPGAEPFVDVGSRVEEDTVVGIIEVMKLMHSIAAGVTGEIVKVCVANGDPAEKGEPLFWVRPDGAGDA